MSIGLVNCKPSSLCDAGEGKAVQPYKSGLMLNIVLDVRCYRSFYSEDLEEQGKQVLTKMVGLLNRPIVNIIVVDVRPLRKGIKERC